MRQLVIFFLFLANTSSLKAQDSGIRFFQGDWKELLAASKESGKPIFVDVYTDWCIPCKKMEKEVFVLPEVAKFYNDNFIAYRLNAEKNEGSHLASRYQVKAYPTWLFLNADETLRSRSTDYLPAEQFITIGKIALGSGSAADSLALLKSRFDKGERNTEFLSTYLISLKKAQLDNREVIDAFVSAFEKDKRVTAENIQFLIQHSGRTWSSAIPLITNHLGLLQPSKGGQAAADFFGNTLYFVWGNAAKAGDAKLARQSKISADKILPLLSEQQQRSYEQLALFHYKTFRDLPGLKKLAYRMAQQSMAVDTAFAAAQDRILFEKVKAAFATAPKDSADREAMEAEKKLALHQYSGQLASLLYQLAEACAELLDKNDPARRDALHWAERAYVLIPNPNTKALLERLK